MFSRSYRISPLRGVSVCLLAFLIASCAAATARAQIDFYRFFKTDNYQQTSDAQPTVAESFVGNVDILFDDGLNLTPAQVSSTSPLSPMPLGLVAPGNLRFSQLYASAAARDVDFPAGTSYDYQVTDGPVGPVDAVLNVPVKDLFAPQVPYFTGTTYDQLQGLNPTNDFTLPFNGYATPDGINTPLIFIGINRVSDGQSVYGNSGPSTSTSFTIPGNTLEPGTQYDVSLVYSARIDTARAGFGGATSEVGFDLHTDLIFTTAVPEPATWLLAVMGGAGFLGWRQRSGCGSQRHG
ncbi:MAG TPA: PEP-CTERM sorting domain-containing protein [Pirellulales bacterium]|jgi:hypothetical protein